MCGHVQQSLATLQAAYHTQGTTGTEDYATLACYTDGHHRSDFLPVLCAACNARPNTEACSIEAKLVKPETGVAIACGADLDRGLHALCVRCAIGWGSADQHVAACLLC